MLIQFHDIQPIAGDQTLEDLAGNGASARADFQDVAGAARTAKWSGEGAGEKAAAGKDRAGGAEVPARFPEESPTFAKEVHCELPGCSATARRHGSHIAA